MYQDYAPRLIRYAVALCRSADLAGDAVQEAFYRYVAERNRGAEIADPRAWLYRTLRDELFRRRAAVARDDAREVTPRHMASISDPADDLDARVERREIARELAALLSTREREALGLRGEGFSYLQIAAIMGLKIGTVGALLTRAHQKIRRTAGHSGAAALPLAGAIHYLFSPDEPLIRA